MFDCQVATKLEFSLQRYNQEVQLHFKVFSPEIKYLKLVYHYILIICTIYWILLKTHSSLKQVNDMDMKGVTREEAVLFLLSLQEQIDLIVQHRQQEFDQIVASGKGDSFHIK